MFPKSFVTNSLTVTNNRLEIFIQDYLEILNCSLQNFSKYWRNVSSTLHVEWYIHLFIYIVVWTLLHYCVVEDLNMVKISLCICYQWNMSSIFSGISEANLEDMSPVWIVNKWLYVFFSTKPRPSLKGQLYR